MPINPCKRFAIRLADGHEIKKGGRETEEGGSETGGDGTEITCTRVAMPL